MPLGRRGEDRTGGRVPRHGNHGPHPQRWPPSHEDWTNVKPEVTSRSRAVCNLLESPDHPLCGLPFFIWRMGIAVPSSERVHRGSRTCKVLLLLRPHKVKFANQSVSKRMRREEDPLGCQPFAISTCLPILPLKKKKKKKRASGFSFGGIYPSSYRA